MPLPSWPPGGVPSAHLADDIAAWLDSPALTALVEEFGGQRPTGDLGARLHALDAFSEVWDGRCGGERATAVYDDVPPDRVELIDAAARALGLTDREHPTAAHYDHVLILGGTPASGRTRALFAAGIVRSISARTITALGSMRHLPTDPGTTEGDAMLAAVLEAFPPNGGSTGSFGTTPDGHPWWLTDYQCETWEVAALAAPPTRPGRRANTADTLLGWARYVTRPAPTDRVLLVTTDRYVPFQHADAIAVLGLTYRCGIETVGFSTRTFPAWPGDPSSSGELLQELRSTIRSLLNVYRLSQLS